MLNRYHLLVKQRQKSANRSNVIMKILTRTEFSYLCLEMRDVAITFVLLFYLNRTFNAFITNEARSSVKTAVDKKQFDK